MAGFTVSFLFKVKPDLLDIVFQESGNLHASSR
jgi:hypothetical protein